MFRSLACLLLVAIFVAPSLGQEIPAEEAEQLKTDWTLEKIENPPARTVKFVNSESPWQSRLTRIDPALIEQKFAARFPLAIRKVDYTTIPSELNPLVYWRAGETSFFFFNRQGGGPGDGRDYPKNLAATFALLAKQIPAEHRPTEKQLDFFVNTKLEDGYLQIGSRYNPPPRSGIEEIRTFTILAPTAEQAQERAQTLLKLLDWGLSRPVQRAKWEQRTKLLAEYPQSIARIEETKAEYAKLQQEYAEFKEFTADLRPGVKVQLAQADADLADATARAVECEKLIADGGLSDSGRQQILNMRLTLRVEIKGLTARRETLTKYLENIATATQLLSKRQKASEAAQLAPYQPGRDLKNAILMTRMLDSITIQVIDDTVQIQPVKWEP